MNNSDADDVDNSKQPTAPFKDLVTELQRDANASALLNIPDPHLVTTIIPLC